MCRSGRFFVRLLGIAATAAGISAAAGATAQENVSTRVLFDDDRVRVQEVRFKPGDQGPNIPRPLRVIRVLAGGTMQRSYSDGTTQTVAYKTGEVVVYEADKPFVPTNVGKSDIVLYVVALKQRPR